VQSQIPLARLPVTRAYLRMIAQPRAGVVAESFPAEAFGQPSGAAARHRTRRQRRRSASEGPRGARRATAAGHTDQDGSHATLTRAARRRHPRHPLPGSRVPCQCRSPPARRVRQRRVLARHRLPGILADDRNIGNDTGPASPALLAFVYPHRDVDGFQGLAHHTGQVRADRL
jgi:hypothetical protein